MRVDRYDGNAVSTVQDNVRGLAPDPGQALQIRAILRDLTLEGFDETARKSDQMSRFGAVEADRFDEIADAFLSEVEHLLRRIRQSEKSRRRLVDARVRCLGRQNDGNKQSERIDRNQLAFRLRVGGFETLEDFGDDVSRDGLGLRVRPLWPDLAPRRGALYRRRGASCFASHSGDTRVTAREGGARHG